MGKVTKYFGDYEINQVDYPRSLLHGDYDIVCQVKLYYREVCHCTWHPDGTIHCKDRWDKMMSPSNCPCVGSSDCLRK